MKKPRKAKKISTAKQVKKLFNRCSDLWREHAYLRDGLICQVKKHFPQIQVMHSEIFQVDHCFSRNNKHLFFDTSNSTVVCRNCNGFKHRQQKGVHLAVHEIVKKREGEDIYNRMLGQEQRKGANMGWGKIWWLESQCNILTELTNEQKKNKCNM